MEGADVDEENAEDPTGSVDTVIVRDGTPAQGGTEIPPENTYDGGGGGGGGGGNPSSPGEDLIDAPPSNDTPAPQGGGQTASTEATTTGPPEQNKNNQANPDESAIPPEEPEPISVGGRVLVQFLYMPNANKINLSLIRVGDMPPPERGGSENIQVHLCILPQRKQRCRTKAVPTSKGVFNETFQFIHMTKDVVERCAIRIRVYGTQRFSKRLIGETRIPLSQVDLTGPLCDETIWKNLSPKGLVDETIGNPDAAAAAAAAATNAADTTDAPGSSYASLGDPTEDQPLTEDSKYPELYVNLHYQDLTGRLHVDVIKAANLRTKDMAKNPNPFIRIKAISGKGKKIGKSTTALHFLESHPEFNETFVYPMSPIDLKQATIMFSVYSKGKRNKEILIGWFAFGQNTSGANETKQWKEMVDNPDCDIAYWQKLQTA